ncbi:MAG: hypothetical protein PHG11_05980, partial [Eubacteriales bacterium]|nr:hypothetical protein [Eubacteriales bacterium]
AGSVVYRYLIGNAQAVFDIGQDEGIRITLPGQELKFHHEAGRPRRVNDFDSVWSKSGIFRLGFVRTSRNGAFLNLDWSRQRPVPKNFAGAPATVDI